ncbi:homocysteine S-methyltransferase family protein [Primorskyibacter aestuariivivens]|uniref:homocysteine S-methyltransferase family protein n=1 Tax=Primorskyibacter aestuariivivens TaxID=1888912 RepID=UPI002300D1A0|nr:homocysteine S-methyltransferase family protein [Primorskyibacter aestuariivivens]MDA7429752.1 homocysteine S-methyltransferase family protein [Primorskyibacter aestuariivivens]
MTDITILDGGMGQELIKRSGQPATPLWSTQVMIDKPGLVGEVHTAYAEAGAMVATTNSYAIHRDRLRGGASNHYASDGVELPDMQDRFEALHMAALKEADAVRGRCRIAGSIGPLGASYRPDLHPGLDEATALYAEIVHLQAPHVDMLLFETIASLEAARACLAAGRQSDRPVWLAFTVDDENGSLLRSGEPMAEAARIGAEADAVLANCSAPEAMPRALDALAGAGVPIGAYANAFAMITKDFIKGGTTASDLRQREDMVPRVYADHAMRWVDQGATIIGGCCETGPDHIAEIAKRVKARG